MLSLFKISYIDDILIYENWENFSRDNICYNIYTCIRWTQHGLLQCASEFEFLSCWNIDIICIPSHRTVFQDGHSIRVHWENLNRKNINLKIPVTWIGREEKEVMLKNHCTRSLRAYKSYSLTQILWYLDTWVLRAFLDGQNLLQYWHTWPTATCIASTWSAHEPLVVKTWPHSSHLQPSSTLFIFSRIPKDSNQ